MFRVLSPDGRLFALKRVSLLGVDHSTLRGYINEIALLKKLANCDRIIKLFDCELNEREGFLHMVMECGEIDLSHVLQKEKVGLNSVRVYWEQVRSERIADY